MTTDAVWAAIWAVFDPLTLVMTAVAGLGMGVVMSFLSRYKEGNGLDLVAFLMGALGVMFFIARGIALYFSNSNLWPRNIAFAILWVLYVCWVTLPIYIRSHLEESHASRRR